MANPIKRAAMSAVKAVAFGAGLAEGAVKAIAQRVRRQQPRVPLHVPTQRENQKEKQRPTVPTRPTPDPYDVGVTTPVGTTGAAPAYNPSTAEADLQQPGTEQIMEPSTTKRIKSETDTLRRAAERNPD